LGSSCRRNNKRKRRRKRKVYGVQYVTKQLAKIRINENCGILKTWRKNKQMGNAIYMDINKNWEQLKGTSLSYKVLNCGRQRRKEIHLYEEYTEQNSPKLKPENYKNKRRMKETFFSYNGNSRNTYNNTNRFLFVSFFWYPPSFFEETFLQ
jgi:hypothetical protein